MNTPVKIHPMDELHNKAMELASIAYSAKRKGEKVNLQQLYLEAFEYEKAAAMLLVNAYAMEPTRAVYFRSAASLLLCLPELRRSDYEEAERMIALGLAGNPHPEIADELREVRKQLEQKYKRQLWEKEFLANGAEFEKRGFFTAINLNTLEFEFKVVEGADLKGNYPLELDEKIRAVSFTNAYLIKGKVYADEQIAVLSNIESVEA